MPSRDKQSVGFQFFGGAGELIGIAKRAAAFGGSGASLTDKELRDRNLVAVVFSAVAVEAFLNELTDIDWMSSELPSLAGLDERVLALKRVLRLAEESNLQAPAKLRLVHELLGRPLETDRQPFQDYHLLKQLRDCIVHTKPTSVQITGDPIELQHTGQKLLRALQSRGLLSHDPSKKGRGVLEWFGGGTLGPWATQAAGGMIAHSIQALPDGQFKEVVGMQYRDFSG